MLNSLKSFWQTEWTAVWGWTKVTIGGLWFTLGTLLQDTDVKAAIPGLGLPTWVPLLLAILGVITLASMKH